ARLRPQPVARADKPPVSLTTEARQPIIVWTRPLATSRGSQGSQAPPLKGYDELSVDEVQRKVEGLSNEEIREIRDYEKRHENRKI
ncbi:MAG: hypothetical protein M3R38_19485, partial [Actinomycetota bacterium]|nr:hypothetical protein [Actinomycetota bacterium]